MWLLVGTTPTRSISHTALRGLMASIWTPLKHAQQIIYGQLSTWCSYIARDISAMLYRMPENRVISKEILLLPPTKRLDQRGDAFFHCSVIISKNLLLHWFLVTINGFSFTIAIKSMAASRSQQFHEKQFFQKISRWSIFVGFPKGIWFAVCCSQVLTELGNFRQKNLATCKLPSLSPTKMSRFYGTGPSELACWWSQGGRL